MLKHTTKKLTGRQEGFASIVIALVIILVMSLLSVSFAQLARREQRNALDKQLALQAYYAAESGINDVVKNLDALRQYTSTHSVSPNTCLDGTALQKVSHTPSVHQSNGVAYTCILFDDHLKDLPQTSVQEGNTRRLVFSTSSRLGSLDLDWSSGDGQSQPLTTSAAACSPTPGTCFNPWSGNWKAPAVVQFSITKIGNVGSIDRNYMSANTFTTYLYPTTQTAKIGAGCASASGSCVTFDTANQAPVVDGGCSAAGACHARVAGINGNPNEFYLIRMTPFFDKVSNITPNTPKDTLGTTISFEGGQVEIDVTGKAKNVLKRINSRVNLDPAATHGPGTSSIVTNYSLEGQNICKRIATRPGHDDYYRTDGQLMGAYSGQACWLGYVEPPTD